MTYAVTGPYFDCLKLPIWLVYHTFPKTRDPKDNKKLTFSRNLEILGSSS